MKKLKADKTMKAIKSIFVLFFCGLALTSSAQFSKGEKKYQAFQYADAIPYFKEATEKDNSNLQAWMRLAECYRLTNDVVKAEDCYSKIAARQDCPPIAKFHYAQMLLTNGEHERALFWFKEYQAADPSDKRAQDFVAAIEQYDLLVADSTRYTVKKININSEDADYGAIPYKDGIIFSSSRLSKDGIKTRDSWTGNRFMSMYYAKGSDETFAQPEIFAKPAQTQYNNGPLCFNNNVTEMYFTRNNTDDYSDDKIQVDKLKIFSIVLENGKFGVTKAFPYNNDSYSCAHPVLSQDGSHLFFSSDMPGGFGGMDIWVCEKVTEGWGAPQNLGPNVNTMGNEIFPMINNDGKFYFSSNGLGGMGGLDIFSTTFENGEYTVPKNLGAPVNSPDDDFCFYYDITKRSGYFSSNRGHQGYNDDIFAFTSNEIMLSGQVFDKITNYPLANSTVSLYDHGRQYDQVKTDADGKFTAWVLPNKDYKLVAENMKHMNDTTNVHTGDHDKNGGKLTLSMSLTNKMEKNDKFVLHNIYYDYNKSKIRPDAAKELDRLVSVLNENPNSKIELSSHTDCRADDKYNQKLSEKRAEAAVKYLVKHGIDENRLTAAGYGKSRPLKVCDCDKSGKYTCTEQDHQMNRRTEIKVIE
jgi:peptidoglycan-associated lipoprotein